MLARLARGALILDLALLSACGVAGVALLVFIRRLDRELIEMNRKWRYLE